MEPKTTRSSAAAMAALCVLLALMLSTMPGKAAAESKFCKCYQACYTECRKTVSWGWRFTCWGRCLNDCGPRKLDSDAACTRACSVGGGLEDGICNSLEPAGPAPDRDATAACVRGCNRWRHQMNK